MKEDRKRKLEKNFFKIFFVNSLLNIKMINIVVSLFYVYRSLVIADVFYLGIVYSITVVLSEVPSSYLADKFGRKRTIVMAALFSLLQWVFFLIAHDFLFFAIGIIFYALAGSFMSGTDEAIVYDTNKELGNHDESLKKLGRYLSSERIFKIMAAFLGALIARDLAGWQFNLLIMVDIVASIVAIILSLTLVEPNHFMDVEKQEAGVIQDAYKILSNDRQLLRTICSRLFIQVASITCWRYSAVFFVDKLKIPLVILGVVWSLNHAVIFWGNYFVHILWRDKKDSFKINSLNSVFALALVLFFLSWFFFPGKYILLAVYVSLEIAAALRDPFFSHIFNKQFSSYNRATALSLANFVRHIFEIPVLLLVGWLVTINIVFPYAVALALGLVTIFYFRVSEKSIIQQNYEPKTI